MPDLWEWQARENDLHWNPDQPFNDKRALFAGTRLGKTFAAIDWYERLRDRKGARLGVVTTLLTACPQWKKFIEADGIDVIPAYAMRVDAIKKKLKDRPDGPAIILLNDDKLPLLVDPLLNAKIDTLVGDESQRFRGVTSRRGKAFRRLAWGTPYVRILSGTPAPNHYGDLWGQMVALDRDRWGTYSTPRNGPPGFADRFLVRDAVYRSQVIAHRDTETLREMILERASIIRREDVFGPDHWQPVERDVEMPEEAWRLYRQLAREWILDEPHLEAANVLVRMLRLQQITSGFVPTPEGGLVPLHDAKINALAADLEEIRAYEDKAVVFHRFREEGRLVVERLGGKAINGDTPVSERGRIIDDFARLPGPQLAVVQSQSGGTGISFATAKYAHFLSRSFNFDEDMQARDRIFAPHEQRVVHYYSVPGTIDDYITEVLRSKQNVHEAIRHADRESLVYGSIRSRRKKI